MKIYEEMSFHKIQTKEIPFIDVEKEFSWLELIHEGTSSSVYAAKHRDTDRDLVLKAYSKTYSNLEDFFREAHYNFLLSPHINIINSYEAIFQTKDSYVYTLDLAPEGDLSTHLLHSGLGEIKSKKVIEQVCSSLEFIHSKNLVYGCLHPENILVFFNDMAQVKLCDFQLTKQCGSRVIKTNDLVPWEPPEVCEAKLKEHYYLHSSVDSWQLGILIFYCLTGSYPWFSADSFDPYYLDWVSWLNHSSKSIPEHFKSFTPYLLRLLTQLLDPNPENRASIDVVNNYYSCPWIIDELNYIDCMESYFEHHKSRDANVTLSRRPSRTSFDMSNIKDFVLNMSNKDRPSSRSSSRRPSRTSFDKSNMTYSAQNILSRDEGSSKPPTKRPSRTSFDKTHVINFVSNMFHMKK